MRSTKTDTFKSDKGQLYLVTYIATILASINEVKKEISDFLFSDKLFNNNHHRLIEKAGGLDEIHQIVNKIGRNLKSKKVPTVTRPLF